MKKFYALACAVFIATQMYAGVRASDFRDGGGASAGFLIFIGIVCLLLLLVIIYADFMNKNKKK